MWPCRVYPSVGCAIREPNPSKAKSQQTATVVINTTQQSKLNPGAYEAPTTLAGLLLTQNPISQILLNFQVFAVHHKVLFFFAIRQHLDHLTRGEMFDEGGLCIGFAFVFFGNTF